MEDKGMVEEIEILKTVVRRLEVAAIPYMITGSIATNFYAVPRMTRDIDIVIELKTVDLDRIMRLFEKDFYIDRDMMANAVKGRDMFNIIHNESIVKIDFIVRKDIPYRQIEFDRRRTIDVEGTRMSVVSPEDLILSKLYWAKDSLSETQLRDVKNILETVEKLDLPYIEKWVHDLGLEPVYEKAAS